MGRWEGENSLAVDDYRSAAGGKWDLRRLLMQS